MIVLNNWYCLCADHATGLKHLSGGNFSLKRVVTQEAVSSEPILLVVSAGSDPSQDIQELAVSSVGSDRFHQVRSSMVGTVKAEIFGGVLFSVTSVPTIITDIKAHRKFWYNRYCIQSCSTSTLTWRTGFTENFPLPNRRFWRIPKILHHQKFLLLQYTQHKSNW